MRKEILFLCLIMLAISCKKDKQEPDLIHPLPNLHLENSTTTIQSLVSYHAAHDVLVFDSFEDVGKLEEYLNNLDPYDRGNKNDILALLNQISIHGFAYGDPAIGNEVQLEEVQSLLEASHPLSDEVLLSIISINETVSFPEPFLEEVFVSNIPFSYQIEEGINQANGISVPLSNIIRIAVDNQLDHLNYAYKDFLNVFPNYNSLYKKMFDQNLQDLEAGMSPGSEEFDQSPIRLDFDRLIRNEKYEVYIEDQLFKMYSDCKEVIFKKGVDQAYDDLQVIDPNGNPTIPNLQEPPQGILDDVMAQYVPTGFMSYNPVSFDPLATVDDDPWYNTAMQTYNIIEFCPTSNFIYSHTADDFTVDFTNTTDLINIGNPAAIYSYWKFGDGSGSFLQDPVHTFPGYGTYKVSLTSFSEDCGCWHIHTADVSFYQTKEGNIDCGILVEVEHLDDTDDIKITTTPLTPAVPGNFPVFYTYFIYQIGIDANGDLTQNLINTINTSNAVTTYTTPGNGIYYVTAEVVWDDGCTTPSDPHQVTISNPTIPSSCCDIKDKLKEKQDTVTCSSTTYLFKYKDVVRGQYNKRIGGQQSLWRENKTGLFNWRRLKADHEIRIEGQYYILESKDKTKCSTIKHPAQYDDADEKITLYYGLYLWASDNFGLKGNEAIKFRHWSSYGSCVIVADKQVKLGDCPN